MPWIFRINLRPATFGYCIKAKDGSCVCLCENMRCVVLYSILLIFFSAVNHKNKKYMCFLIIKIPSDKIKFDNNEWYVNSVMHAFETWYKAWAGRLKLNETIRNSNSTLRWWDRQPQPLRSSQHRCHKRCFKKAFYILSYVTNLRRLFNIFKTNLNTIYSIENWPFDFFTVSVGTRSCLYLWFDLLYRLLTMESLLVQWLLIEKICKEEF